MTKEKLEKEAKEKFEQYKLKDEDYVEYDGEKILMFNREYYAEDEYFRFYCNGYLAGAEPREKHIEELIALINAERERQEKCDDVHLRKIADLEKENAELKQAEKGKVVEHFEAYGQCRDSRRIAELEAENAELKRDKEDLIFIRNQNAKCMCEDKERFIKAKELLKQWLQTSKASGCDNINIVTDTEQFLKEVEK